MNTGDNLQGKKKKKKQENGGKFILDQTHIDAVIAKSRSNLINLAHDLGKGTNVASGPFFNGLLFKQ